MDRLERAIESIQHTIENNGGSLVVKMKVRRSRCYISTRPIHVLACCISRKRSLRQKSMNSRSSWQRQGVRMRRYLGTKMTRKPSSHGHVWHTRIFVYISKINMVF